MTTQHWYDDSNGKGGAFQGNQAFLPVMMGFFVVFLLLKSLHSVMCFHFLMALTVCSGTSQC